MGATACTCDDCPASWPDGEPHDIDEVGNPLPCPAHPTPGGSKEPAEAPAGQPSADALNSLLRVMNTDPRDWSANFRDAWLYGIVVGWDDALADVASRFGWSETVTNRLAGLCRAFRAAFAKPPNGIAALHHSSVAPDLVERLAELSWNASAPDMWPFIPDYRKDVHRAHVRAVLSELVAMGATSLPEPAEVFAACDEITTSAQAAEVVEFYQTRVAPVLGAMLVIAERDAKIAEQAREIEQLRADKVRFGVMYHNAAVPRFEKMRDERDVALAEVARLKAEVEAMRARVRILEIAPGAARYANGRDTIPGTAEDAVRVIERGKAETPWERAVLEYAAREGAP
jgi:hypothetical protein